MKQPKKPTRAQKELMSRHKMNANNWAIAQEDEDGITVVNKATGTKKKICF